MSDQTGRVVLVTGCSSGIGRATAVYLAQRGWRVYASARRLDDISGLQTEQLVPLVLDVTDEDARKRAVDQIAKQAGRLDALVNNAGTNIGGPLELVSLDDAREQFEINVWGALRLIQLVVPIMRQQGGGRVVNITSVMGKYSLPYSGLYSASKYALEALSDTLRWELSPWNIQVCIIEPGSIESNIGSKARVFRQRFSDDPRYARYLGANGKVRTAAVHQGNRLFGLVQAVGRALVDKQPQGVARVIEQALTDEHPRARYKSGLDAHVYLLMRWLMPDRLYDYAVRRFYGFRPIAPEGTGGADSNHE